MGMAGTSPSQHTVVLTKQAYIELKWQANYWRAQHERLVEREVALKGEVEVLQAADPRLEPAYPRRSEQSAASDGPGESTPASARKRGRDPGRRGIAAVIVAACRGDGSARLQRGGEALPSCGRILPFPGTEESEHYRSPGPAPYSSHPTQALPQEVCGVCPQSTGIITAPPAPRLIPKSPLGVSVWTRVLFDE